MHHKQRERLAAAIQQWADTEAEDYGSTWPDDVYWPDKAADLMADAAAAVFDGIGDGQRFQKQQDS